MSNISKTEQVETLGKTIFESPYGVLHVSLNDVN